MNNIPAAVEEYIAAYRYKIELHAHTSPVSGCSELVPEEFIERLHSKNFDAVVVTNHFNQFGGFLKAEDPVGAYLDDFYRTKEAAKKYGMTVLLGAEFRFEENSNDYLVFGVDEAFLRETVTKFSMSFTEFYETYHSEDRLILQAHPFRDGMTRMPADHMDGLEAFNMHPGHNSRIAFASRYAIENDFPVITIGTDLHHREHEGASSLRAKYVPQTEKELVALLRSRDYIFEIGGHPILPYINI